MGLNEAPQIEFLHDHPIDQRAYTFVIIVSHYKDGWIWVRHTERDTWELPAGHVEHGETADEAAARELFEETGAIEYVLHPIVSYRGLYQSKEVLGKIFLARIHTMEPLPDYEIAEISFIKEGLPERLTYPSLQPLFFRKVIDWLQENQLIL